MQSRYKELVKNVGLITVGKVLAKVVGILILPFYTTYLTPDDYGRIDMVTAYCALFLQPVTLCIDSAIFIFPSRKPADKKKKYYSSGLFISFFPITVFCIAMYLLTCLASGLSEESFLGTLTQNSFLLCLLVISGFLGDFMQQMLRSLNKIAQYAAIGILQSLSMIVFALVLLPKFGTKGYIYSLFLSSISVVLVMFTFGRLWKWLDLKAVDIRYYWQMLRFSIPLIPAPALVWVQTQSSRPMLASYYGMAAVGIFGFAIRFPAMIGYFADSLSKAWEISALREHGKEGFSSFYNNVCVLFFVAGSAVCALFPIAVEPVFKLLINEKFHSAIQYVPAATLSVFWGICGQLLGTNLTVRKQSYKFFWSSMVAAGVVGIGNWLFIPRFGVWGACCPMMAATLAVVIVRYAIADSMFRIASAGRICTGIALMVLWVWAYTVLANGLALRLLVSIVALTMVLLLFFLNIKRILVCRFRQD